MTMLAERVDVVIGVDTHKHTHTAAVVQAVTGGVLAQATISADPAGYDQLLALAAEHPAARAWALEGAGGYGAGLTRHLHEVGEEVIELDRPRRPARKAGAKSDPIDAIRAARDALARTWQARPKTGAARAAVQMHTTARRSAVQAAGDAQRQLQAVIVTAPEVVRARFRGHRPTAPPPRSPSPQPCAQPPAAGTPKSWPHSPCCAPWPGGSVTCRPRPKRTRRPSPPTSAPGAQTSSTKPE